MIPPATRSALFTGGIDVTDGTLTAALFSAYTYAATDEFLDDAGTPDDSVLVGSVSVVDGEVYGTVGAFSTVAAGDPVTSVVFYLDTGTPSTSRIVSVQTRYGDGTPISIVRDGSPITLPGWISDRLFGLGSPT